MKLPLIMTLLILAAVTASCPSHKLPVNRETSAGPLPLAQTTGLTEAQAIELAEKFIERNGYTDLPPDKENLASETIEWESNVDDRLKTRHNTLERKAFGIARGRRGEVAGWTVVFKYRAYKNGRAVTMNPDGSRARVEHVDFILAKVEKKL